MKNRRYVIFIEAERKSEPFLDILEFCEKLIKELMRIPAENIGLLNEVTTLKAYWQGVEQKEEWNYPYTVVDPRTESMKFFYDLGMFCQKKKCSVYFRIAGMDQMLGIERKILFDCKRKVNQSGLPVYFQAVMVLDA